MANPEKDLDKLQNLIGYEFQDITNLQRALTHRSHGTNNNERLEFLGDAILSSVIARTLFDQFPAASEGQLSRLRARMVRKETLAEIAREFTIGEFLIMGHGELKSGGYERDSILSNTMEAIIGAISIDGGLDRAMNQILMWYMGRLTELSPDVSQKDAKSRLQEYLQGVHAQLPQYLIVNVKGKSHDQMFTVECQSELFQERTIGEGTSRRAAEQVAAARALVQLGIEDQDPA